MKKQRLWVFSGFFDELEGFLGFVEIENSFFSVSFDVKTTFLSNFLIFFF